MNEFYYTQKKMGCPSCRHCDEDMLGQGPCCNHMRGPLPGEYGRCQRWRGHDSKCSNCGSPVEREGLCDECLSLATALLAGAKVDGS